MLESISLTLAHFFAMIAHAVSGAWNAVASFFGGLFHAAANFFSGLRAGIAHFFHSLFMTIESILDSIGKAILAVIHGIARAPDDVGHGIDHAGQSFLHGLGRLIHGFAFAMLGMLVFSLCIILLCWLLLLILYVIGKLRTRRAISTSAAIRARMHGADERRPLLQAATQAWRPQTPPDPRHTRQSFLDDPWHRQQSQELAWRWVRSLGLIHDANQRLRPEAREREMESRERQLEAWESELQEQQRWSEHSMNWLSSNPVQAFCYAFSSLHEKAFGDRDCCCICCEDFRASDEIVGRTVCNHMYHVKCLTEWFVSRQGEGEELICPQCRKAFPSPPLEESRHLHAYGTFGARLDDDQWSCQSGETNSILD